MKETICMFCGHRDIINIKSIEPLILKLIEDIIRDKGVNVFLVVEWGILIILAAELQEV